MTKSKHYLAFEGDMDDVFREFNAKSNREGYSKDLFVDYYYKAVGLLDTGIDDGLITKDEWRNLKIYYLELVWNKGGDK